MVVQSYYPLDARVRKEAEALIEADHSVEIICLRYRADRLRDSFNQVQIHRLPVSRMRGSFAQYLFEYASFFLLATLYLSFLQLRRRFDIVCIHNMPDILVFCAAVPWLVGSKIILDVHDPMPELFISQNGFPGNGWLVRLLRLQEKVSHLVPSIILTVNESMRKRIIRLGVSPEKVHTVFNGPDRRIFRVRSNGRVAGRFSLVYTGIFAKRYGLDLAVRAVGRLAEEMPDLKLVLVGEGNFTQELQRLARELHVEDRIEFRDMVALEELPGILGECDVCISPHGKDGFWDLCCSTKILEGAAVGLPVISSRTRTLGYYLGDSIFYFQPGDLDGLVDQIRLVRAEPGLVRKKAAQAARIVEQLCWDREKQKLQRIVSELVQQP